MINPYRKSNVGASLESLCDALAAGTLCPVIGAGASVDVGAPNWGDLVFKLLVEANVVEDNDARRKAFESVPNLVVADYLNERGRFGWRMLDELQRFFAEKMDPDWALDDVYRNSALMQLAKLTILVAKKHPHRTFHGLSYNFDPYLEEAISSLGYAVIGLTAHGVCQWRATGAKAEFWDRGDDKIIVRIAHPHGLAPRPSVNKFTQPFRAVGNFDEDIVLTNSDYVAVLGDAFGLPLAWQQEAFRNLRCMLYGLSFADTAIREILTRANGQPDTRAPIRHVALAQSDQVAGIQGLTEIASVEATLAANSWAVARITGGKGYAWQVRLLRILLALCDSRCSINTLRDLAT